MPIVQRPDLVAKIRKKYELTGPDAISTISPELVPVVLVEDLSSEDPGVLSKFCWGYNEMTAPTNLGICQLWNPAGSGVDLWVDLIEVYAASNATMYFCYFSTVLAAGGGVEVNRGLGASGDPAAVIHTEDNAAPLGTAIARYYYTAGGGPNSHRVHWKIPEGEGIGWRCGATTIAIYGRWAWREVPTV